MGDFFQALGRFFAALSLVDNGWLSFCGFVLALFAGVFLRKRVSLLVRRALIYTIGRLGGGVRTAIHLSDRPLRIAAIGAAIHIALPLFPWSALTYAVPGLPPSELEPVLANSQMLVLATGSILYLLACAVLLWTLTGKAMRSRIELAKTGETPEFAKFYLFVNWVIRATIVAAFLATSFEVAGYDFSGYVAEKWSRFMLIKVADVKLWRISLILCVLLGAFIFKRTISKVIVAILAHLARRTAGKLDDYIVGVMEKPMNLFVVFGALNFVTAVFPWRIIFTADILPTGELIGDQTTIDMVTGYIYTGFVIVYIILFAYFLFLLLDRISQYSIESVDGAKSRFDATLIITFRKFLKVMVLFFAVTMIMDQLGIDVKMVLASFTVATAAVAFASRDAIANVFGALVLSVDRPFSVGDWVSAGGVEGNVEEIGLRSTRIRTFAKSLVHIPNNQLMNMTIDNMTSRPRQRVKASFGVTYDSSPEKMEKLVEGVREIIRANPRTYKDYYQIWFSEFSDSSLQVMLYFFIESTEWAVFLEERQRIYLDIMKLVQRLELEFAFPSQTIYFHDMSSAPGGRTGSL
mgnify:CR=1 FL=1